MDQKQKKAALKILNRLESQKFADWYKEDGRFDDYITVAYPKGDEQHVSKEDILEDIVQLFDL
jgi:hypothetical protein